MRIYQALIFGCIAVLLGGLALPALAEQAELDGSRIDDRTWRGFQSNWRRYAQFASETPGGYVMIPKYDRRLESSAGLTTSQAMEKLTKTWEEQSGALVTKKSKSPPRDDAEAYARALPELKVGAYGWVASAEIVKIIDGKQMIVRELHLVNLEKMAAAYKEDEARMARQNNGEIDRDALHFDYGARIKLMDYQKDKRSGFTRSFRLVGYDTRGLRVGDRWAGPNDKGFQVGVARWETPTAEEAEGLRRDERGPRLVLTEVAQTMRETLDEEGFKKLLKERGMTIADFVELVRTLRETDRENAEERIINALMPEEQVIER